MVKIKIHAAKPHLEIASLSLGLLLPVMFGLSLLQSRFLNNVGMLYLLQDIRYAVIPVGLASLITGWIYLVHSKESRNPRAWMAITGIIMGSLVIVWFILAIFHSALGIGPSE